jgi:hypothetical protein
MTLKHIHIPENNHSRSIEMACGTKLSLWLLTYFFF